MDNLDYINRALSFDRHWLLSCSPSVQWRFIWNLGNFEKLPLTLDTADGFTLQEVKQMLYYINGYLGSFADFTDIPEIASQYKKEYKNQSKNA